MYNEFALMIICEVITRNKITAQIFQRWSHEIFKAKIILPIPVLV